MSDWADVAYKQAKETGVIDLQKGGWPFIDAHPGDTLSLL